MEHGGLGTTWKNGETGIRGQTSVDSKQLTI